MDCTKTKTFLKEWERMCATFPEDCSRCPLNCEDGPISTSCVISVLTNKEESIKTVQMWSDKNPVVTLLDRFRKEHPDAPPGIPKFSPFDLGYIPASLYGELRDVNCWNLSEDDLTAIVTKASDEESTVTLDDKSTLVNKASNENLEPSLTTKEKAVKEKTSAHNLVDEELVRTILSGIFNL